jgi:nitrate reductase delta subunit
MLIYKLLSVLLDYPDAALKENLPEIGALIEGDPDLGSEAKARLHTVVGWMQGQDLLELQSHFVQTFDLTPEHSLHLTHHVFGEDRARGPALVDLGEFYKGDGFETLSSELPDYLPLMLEYAATLDELGARVFLSDVVEVLDTLAANLEKAGSAYAALIHVVGDQGRLAPRPAQIAGTTVDAQVGQQQVS